VDNAVQKVSSSEKVKQVDESKSLRWWWCLIWVKFNYYVLDLQLFYQIYLKQ
jgi:hypothetical protein